MRRGLSVKFGFEACGREAVKEDMTSPGSVGISPHDQASFVQRGPLLSEQAFPVSPGRHFQAAVFQRGRVNRDHRCDENRRIAAPAGLLILVRLEAGSAGHLEVDFVFEQHDRAAHQCGRPAQPERAVPDQRVKFGVKRAEIFDPLNHATPWFGQASS